MTQEVTASRISLTGKRFSQYAPFVTAATIAIAEMTPTEIALLLRNKIRQMGIYKSEINSTSQ